MNEDRGEDRFMELLGPYVLDEVSEVERRELQKHLIECPGCRRELHSVRRAHELLRDSAATEEPPPELKDWVLARARSEGTLGGRSGAYWVSAAAVVLVLFALGAGVLRATVWDRPASLALTATDLAPGAEGELQGEEDGENFRVRLKVSDMPELREGEYYEMWYAGEGGERISCGTFRAGPGGTTVVDLSAPASAVSYPIVEVTREPDDGDPSASDDVVLRGDLRDI